MKTVVRTLGSLTVGLFLATSAMAAPAGPNTSPAKGAHPTTNVATGISGFAVVGSGGNLRQSSNATGSTHFGTGEYIVDFNSNIKACAYTATIGLSGDVGSATPGVITTVQANADKGGVYVSTYSLLGVATDLPFHLVVTC